MRIRPCQVVVAFCLAVGGFPSTAAAQYQIFSDDTGGPGVSHHRLMLTPVIGIRGSLVQDRSLTAVALGDFRSTRFEWGGARSAGPVAGLEADLRLAGSVGVSALGLYLGADDVTMLKSIGSDVVSETSMAGPEVWVAAAALSLRLPDEMPMAPAGYVFAGPAWIRQDYSGSAFSNAALEDRVDSPGIWLGYRALFPVGIDHAALSLALEDVIPMWNRESEGERLQAGLDLSEAAASTGIRGPSHLPMLRIGLALRM